VEGDESVAAAFAEAVASRLAAIPSRPPEDETALLPVHAIDDARRIEDLLRQAARGTTAVLGADGIVDDLGDGSAALRPAVHLVGTAEGVQTSGVSNRGHDSLTVYDVGAEGLVTPRQWTPSGGRWPWFFALTDDSRMIVANNLSDAMTIFDIDSHGELHASDQVTVRRPVFIAPFGPQ